MQRPALTKKLSETEFLHWYWLKSELADFCRELGLPPTGPKHEITKRIAAHLGGRPAPLIKSKPHGKADMPSEFSPSTVIGDGWHCSQQLRAFFESQCGKGFRFNAPLREFIASGKGNPLSSAIDLYTESLRKGPQPIAAQFEYNRHMREFKTLNPNCTHAQIVAAWWLKRGKPVA